MIDNQAQDVHVEASAAGFGPKLLDTKQVAEILHVSESWVREHCHNRQPLLPAMKLGEGKTCLLRFHPIDIQEFVDQQRARAKERARAADRGRN